MKYGFKWDDMSDYLVHFVKKADSGSEYDTIIKICASRKLIPGNAFGIARSTTTITQKSVCFSEIPLYHLERLIARRGAYGIGFTKRLALLKGAAPVWYLERDSRQLLAIKDLMDTAEKSERPADNPIWRLTAFIDAPGDYPNGRYRFEWEREWRVLGTYGFHQTDAAFLLLPEHLHNAARGFFESAQSENTGPAYLCPYIDPHWPKERVVEALQESLGSEQ
jgi:hypothetical protein